jgi:uncharacterized protein
MSSKFRRRAVDESGLEARTESEGSPRKLVGHAAVFDQWAVIARYMDPDTGRPVEFREVIRRGAFRNAIASGQDVRALVDHNSSLILGRTRAGTLVLSEDDQGLLCEITTPETQTAEDVLANVAVRNITQMSFAFLPRPWGETITTRDEGTVIVLESEVTDVDLYDVSVVTYPAYKTTDVEVRSKTLGAKLNSDWLAKRSDQLDTLARFAASRSA